MYSRIEHFDKTLSKMWQTSAGKRRSLLPLLRYEPTVYACILRETNRISSRRGYSHYHRCLCGCRQRIHRTICVCLVRPFLLLLSLFRMVHHRLFRSSRFCIRSDSRDICTETETLPTFHDRNVPRSNLGACHNR